MAPAFFYFLHPELYAEGSSSDCFMVARDVNGNKPDAVKKDSTAGDHPAVLPACVTVKINPLLCRGREDL